MSARATAYPATSRHGPQARHQARRGGFTLLELLVAMAMVGIIAASLYSSLRIAFRARTSAEAAVEPVRTAELAISLMRPDFESATAPSGVLAGPFIATDAPGANGLPADTVEFFTAADPITAAETTAAVRGQAAGTAGPVASAPRESAYANAAASLGGAGEVQKVQLGLVPYPTGAGGTGAADQVLVRRVTSNLLSPVELEPYEEVLCRGVRGFNLRYWDGLTWQDSWDSTQQEDDLPLAVEVVMELERVRDGQVRVMPFSRVFLMSCSGLSPQGLQSGTGSGGGAAP